MKTRFHLLPVLAVTLLATLSAPSAPGAESVVARALPKVRVAHDGRSFVTAAGQPFVPFGVNYYRPGTGWAPQVWKQFDADATRRDFVRLRALGGNCVRVFLTYGSFCSEPGVLSPDGLAKFDRFLALAEEAGIYVHPTGPDHWEGTPAWARGDRFASESHLQALEAFWKAFAARYRGRATLFAYDLLNEPSVPWDSPTLREKWNQWLARRYSTAEKAATAWSVKPNSVAWGQVAAPPTTNAPGSRLLLDYQLFREEIADEWTRRQAAAIKAADSAALVTVGLIQWSVPSLLPGVQHYAAFRPARQARYLDFMEVHFYPLNKGAYEYAGDEDELRNLAYLESVVREVAATAKPVVLAEFGWYGGAKPRFDGGRHPAATEEQQARWNRRLIETTAGLATGWLNWGFHDHPQAHDVSELTGLLTVDDQTKAWGREFQKLSAQFRERAISPRQLGQRPSLDWDRCLTSTKAGNDFREEYFRAFKAELRK
ncbi:MAG: cellulase family glycosylhydrolase [Verrucomicrobia bacterium]|nr:cellulase family glycosylhydrolase [Verrucomicrobiota bacterium]